MKKCSYCGKEYPDEATSCVIDGGQLETFIPLGAPRISHKGVVSGDRKEHRQLVGPEFYWICFLGVPWLFGAILLWTWDQVAHLVGRAAMPYIAYFAPVAVVVVCMVLYDRLPKRLLVGVGIPCWILTFTLLYWFFWFKPVVIGNYY